MNLPEASPKLDPQNRLGGYTNRILVKKILPPPYLMLFDNLPDACLSCRVAQRWRRAP